eukprot:TRINITY_DN447_c0_g1_i1.p1 TRINITY_DN447_c0_g1~~TRINITY_DN447_c0_g1_i1.p1  ORF type:complete len:494 (+),score=154.57 TRINITY_DN447_c0_g1_i1:285-1766(+)
MKQEIDVLDELESLNKKIVHLSEDTIGNTICKEELSTEDRVVGSLLVGMMADAMGAAVEGWPFEDIKKRFGIIKEYEHGTHMGVRNLGDRVAQYTDDSNSMLALLDSLTEKKDLDPQHVAVNYGKFWRDANPKRGYPDSAMSVLKYVLEGGDYKTSAMLVFNMGSFANGGIMRIAPTPLAFRNSDDETLYLGVVNSIISSHVHPEAVDGAWIQAKAITILLKTDPKDFQPLPFLQKLSEHCKTEQMKKNIQFIIDKLFSNEKKVELSEDDLQNISQDQKYLFEITEEFQIKSVDAEVTALWFLARYHKFPKRCICNVITLGGDCDTTGMITGNLIGALYGTSFIPKMWYEKLENEEKGRDFCIEKAKELSKLDLKKLSFVTETPVCEKIALYVNRTKDLKRAEKFTEKLYRDLFDLMKDEDEKMRYDVCICFSGHFFVGSLFRKWREFIVEKKEKLDFDSMFDLYKTAHKKSTVDLKTSTPFMKQFYEFFEKK